MKVYIAGPLFNEMERARNSEMRDFLIENGFDTYLPQEDAGIADFLIKEGRNQASVRKEIFEKDIEAVRSSDTILCLLDGRVPDEGVCIELGLAFALGKKCLGFSTEQRTFDTHGRSLMIDGCLESVSGTKEELLRNLRNN